uniref:Uncharacterized protein K0031E03.43 n=1 Tax=Oryza sativa subsp. indica TaxID=39946 RepID=C8TEV6_ORYSI|nr:hypothetical protein [Oryza sativa Indica Group]BAI39903.1 hypothetical protein [Oryza sativa Indica Group]
MSAASSSHPPPLPLTEPRSSLAAAADSPRINSTIDTPVLSPQPWSPLDAQAADFRAQCRTAVLPNLARLRPHWLSMPPEHYRRRGRHYGPLHCQGQADLVTSPPRLPTPSPSTGCRLQHTPPCGRCCVPLRVPFGGQPCHRQQLAMVETTDTVLARLMHLALNKKEFTKEGKELASSNRHD